MESTLGLGMISILRASASTSLLIAFKFTHLLYKKLQLEMRG